MAVPTTVETVQKEKGYLAQLDGLRFIAVTLVMIDHWLGERVQLPLGYFGVNLFFVLSGFLITRILIISKAQDNQLERTHSRSLKQFYIRRSLRIFPVYYIMLLVLALINFPSIRATLPWFLTYTQNIWVAIHHTWFGAVDHLWSLAVEEQYYLFFPFLVFFIPNRFLLRSLFFLIGISVLLRVYLFATGAAWMVQFVMMPTCLDAFGMGSVLAYGMIFHRERFTKWVSSSWLLLASLALYAFDLYMMKSLAPSRNLFTDVFDRFFTSLFCFFLIGKAVIGFKGVFKTILEHSVSTYLGQISYGLYLFHNLVFNAYHTPPNAITLRIWNRLTEWTPFLTDSPARLLYFYVVTVSLATVSWFLIEKPFNSLKSRFAY
ncbi:acyltransferase family protein [Tellurirhabdus bombi]|uniref:acyltransferase family protein n=1 Tax=Tellurirhabdus bombi TaxID=2907205 RepID=UPI001F1C2E71|nr:acyltransferase [Tellurirhabdus bombi]